MSQGRLGHDGDATEGEAKGIELLEQEAQGSSRLEGIRFEDPRKRKTPNPLPHQEGGHSEK
jgi:hypothetical protein